MSVAGAVVATLLAIGRPTPAMPEAARVIALPVDVTAMAARVPGTVDVGDGVLDVRDVAGDGAPWIGIVERRGPALWLVTPVGALRLDGPLARPRLAGPGYRMWVQGVVIVDGAVMAMRVQRLGVLARP